MFFILMKTWILQGTPVNIIVGSHVWIEDPEIAWIDGQVTKINGEEVTIDTTKGNTVRELSMLYSNIITQSSFVIVSGRSSAFSVVH